METPPRNRTISIHGEISWHFNLRGKYLTFQRFSTIIHYANRCALAQHAPIPLKKCQPIRGPNAWKLFHHSFCHAKLCTQLDSGFCALTTASAWQTAQAQTWVGSLPFHMDLFSTVVSEVSPWLGHNHILGVLQTASALHQSPQPQCPPSNLNVPQANSEPPSPCKLPQKYPGYLEVQPTWDL